MHFVEQLHEIPLENGHVCADHLVYEEYHNGIPKNSMDFHVRYTYLFNLYFFAVKY